MTTIRRMERGLPFRMPRLMSKRERRGLDEVIVTLHPTVANGVSMCSLHHHSNVITNLRAPQSHSQLQSSDVAERRTVFPSCFDRAALRWCRGFDWLRQAQRESGAFLLCCSAVQRVFELQGMESGNACGVMLKVDENLLGGSYDRTQEMIDPFVFTENPTWCV